MVLNFKLLKPIVACLTEFYGCQLNIISTHPLSGGDINQAYCLQTQAGKLMMKLNRKSTYPDMFKRECEGLKAIRNTQSLAVPEVILQDDFEDFSFLLMEWIESAPATPQTYITLGYQLAEMHRQTDAQFGFYHNNYMGSLPQSNTRHNTWRDFFIQERLHPMVRIAVDKQLLNSTDVKQFDELYNKLGSLFTEEPPALIHGDLWGGNYLISTIGKPHLIDPAVTYGNREFDMAMTRLFGGFGHEFYKAYHERFPLLDDWQQRVSLWNLYPLLLYLNLFGSGYLAHVRKCLSKYV